MLKRKQILLLIVFTAFAFTFTVPAAKASGGKEYKAIVSHLKTKYHAKKVKIPFMWLARFAVGVVRPAGVKSFSVTLFQDLKFSSETLDVEMQAAMRNSFSADWSPIFHVRSRTGQQVYMYMRQAENSDSVKIALVTIDKEQAAVIRATFSPDKLAEFINNPKILGVSLDDNNQETENDSSNSKKDLTVETPKDK